MTVLEKHDGVSFEEAATAFDDPMQTTLRDDVHSEGEQRYILLATSESGRVLAISYRERLIQLAPDVAEVFNTSEAANEALRTLIRIMRREMKNAA